MLHQYTVCLFGLLLCSLLTPLQAEEARQTFGTSKAAPSKPEFSYKSHYGAPSYGLNAGRHHHYRPRPNVIYSYPIDRGQQVYQSPITANAVTRSYSGPPPYTIQPSAAPATLSGLDIRHYPRDLAQPKHADPWQSLASYDLRHAMSGFNWQMDDRPYAALPQVGYALTLAMYGDVHAARTQMQQAFSGNISQLHQFHSNTELKLIVEEVMLSYQDDAFMHSALLYLRQDYPRAKHYLNQALTDCHHCTSAENLGELLAEH